MEHHFNIAIACKYGVLEAILINNFEYWIKKNEANNINFKDGTYWTFNSTKAFQQLFPYVSERQIRDAINHLINEGILITNNYNASTYDRTKWYAFDKNATSIMQKCQMEYAKMSNGFDKSATPIPNNKHIYKNTYNKESNRESQKIEDVSGNPFMQLYCEERMEKIKNGEENNS